MKISKKTPLLSGQEQNKITLIPKKGAGFTIIELLVVIAIIGLMVVATIVAVQKSRQKSKIAKVQSELNQIATAIRMLENDSRQWPGHQEVSVMCQDLPGGCPGDNELCGDGCTNGLNAGAAGLTQNDLLNPYDNWKGPYIIEIPLDPWGNEYFFGTDYNHSTYGWVVVVGSYGPDGIGNDIFNEDDIVKIIY